MFKSRMSWTIPVLICLCAPALLLADDGEGAMTIPPKVLALVLSLPALLMGIGFHEWAHAWTADRLGDPTPRDDGRLSLNPLDHLDPMGTILMVGGIVFGWPVIGWGRAVEISPGTLRSPIKDKMKIALAGPMMNMLIVAATMVCIQIYLLASNCFWTSLPQVFWDNSYQLLFKVILINASLAVFNMIPIPPLDGAKVLENWLTAPQTQVLRDIEPYGIVLVYMLLQMGIFSLPFTMVHQGVSMMMHSAALSVGFLAVMLACWYGFVKSLPKFGAV